MNIFNNKIIAQLQNDCIDLEREVTRLKHKVYDLELKKEIYELLQTDYDLWMKLQSSGVSELTRESKFGGTLKIKK